MMHLMRQIPPELLMILISKCIFVGILILLIDKYTSAHSGIKVLINVMILLSMSLWVLGLFYSWNMVHPAH